ncbi:MAG: hypothetical protein ACK56X_00900, partial [Planctomyces sp.]
QGVGTRGEERGARNEGREAAGEAVKGPAGPAGIWSFVSQKCVVHSEAAWTVQQAQLRSGRDMSSE